VRAALRDPVALLWLAAVGLLAFRWLSPLTGFYERAILSDGLIALAAVGWLVQIGFGRRRFQLQRWQLWLAAYLLAVAVSALAAPERTTAFETVLLVSELATFAVLTAHLAAEASLARACARVVLVSVGLTLLLTIAGEGLFYAGERTGLLGVYGEQFEASSRYARIQAGFASPPLLASWCIAVAAVLAWPRAGLPRRWVVAAHAALAVVVVLTYSRGALVFMAGLVLLWAVAEPSRRRTRIAAATVLGVVAVLAALTVGRLHLDPTRVDSISYVVPDPGNRREGAATAWDTLVAHPLVGSGPGSLPGSNRGVPFRAHFTPLNVAATTGLPALLALFAMVVALRRRGIAPEDRALWAGLAALAVDGLAQDVEHFRHVWLVLGLAGAATIGSRRRAPREPPCATT
jgi:hypothetical protein